MDSGKDDLARNTDRNGDPNVFNLNWNGEQLKLNGNNAKPDNRWNRENGFAFAVSQLSSFLSLYLGEFCFVS